MTSKKWIGGLKIRIKFTSGGVAQVSKIVRDQFKTSVLDKAVSTFLEINPTASEQAVIEGGDLFTSSSPLGAGVAPLSTYKSATDLKRLYVKAWKKTYERYINKHRQITPEAKYAKVPWVRYKRNNQGAASPFMSSLPLKYKNHSLATGYLRDSIAQAFDDGGDAALSVFNLLVKGGYRWEKSYYASSHPKYHKWIERISSRFETAGMYSQFGGTADSIVQLDPGDWDEIARLMLKIYKDGPVEDVKNLLTTFTIEV